MKKENNNHSIEENISLEEIAQIVENYIQEEDVPIYDGYDVSIEDIEGEIDNNKNNIHKNEEIKKEPIIKEINKNKIEINKNKINEKESNKKKVNKKEINKKEQNHIKKELNKRFISIDIIKGIAIITIILASGLGVSDELPKYLLLSSWNGIKFVDLGVPVLVLATCFMIPSNIERDLKRKICYKDIIIKKLIVGISTFLIGLLLNVITSSDINHFRIMGILQFISIVYIIVSLIYIAFRKFNLKINVLGIILLVLGSIGLILYFIISKKFGNDMKNCLALFVDSRVLKGHFYTFERYGMISTISAIFSGIISLSGGTFLLDKKSDVKEKMNRLIILGMGLIIISLILEKTCPHNVNIWSSSFSFIVLGSFMIVESIMYFLFDFEKNFKLYKLFYPLIMFGKNSFLLLVITEVLKNTLFKLNVYSIAMGKGVSFGKWIVIDCLSEIFGSSSRAIVFLILYLIICLISMIFIHENASKRKSK